MAIALETISMNKDQTSASIERVITVFITWLFTYLTTKGIITSSQAAEFMPLALTLLVGVYGWWISKPTNILLAAKNLPGTTVITTPELAAATPSDKVISNTEDKTVIANTIAQNANGI